LSEHFEDDDWEREMAMRIIGGLLGNLVQGLVCEGT